MTEYARDHYTDGRMEIRRNSVADPAALFSREYTIIFGEQKITGIPPNELMNLCRAAYAAAEDKGHV